MVYANMPSETLLSPRDLEDPPIRANLNQLFGVADPSTASALGGQVVGGLPLRGGFYSTPTSVASQTDATNPTPSINSLLAQPTTQGAPIISTTAIPLESTQVDRTPNISTNLPISSAVPSPMSNGSTNGSTNPMSYSDTIVPQNTISGIPVGALAGIISGVVLLVLLVPLLYWYAHRRRRTYKAKEKSRKDSFVLNPIVNSLLVSNQSSASFPFRGTPYRGEEGDMYYPKPPSMRSNPQAYPKRTFRPPQSAQLSAPTEYLSNNSYASKTNLLGSSDHFQRETLVITNPPSSENFSDQSDLNASSRTGSTSFSSLHSTTSILFPQVAVFRNVPKSKTGIAVQNAQADRIKSHIVTPVYDAAEFEMEKNRDTTPTTSSSGYSSFYLPRFGDAEKTIIKHSTLLNQDLKPAETGIFNAPPRVPSMIFSPQAPGAILSRYHYQDDPIESDKTPNQKTTQDQHTQPPTTAASNNRYIPSKTKKRNPNANVLSVLNNSSRQKSLRKSESPPTHTGGNRATATTINSIDVPDPYAYGPVPAVPNQPAIDKMLHRI
ncbi:hypothetical protein O181_057392 [Austropuccinia psidii MF-1]|uniref:Uncharacterized protein n=1 Tax=Austropuccinia psidii MF-1 TaxID=1389203 RepID=A0A9Q3HVE5_9BASI|nr:hypothetical protein [Austropuccinia psidii MF-1]